MRYFYPVLIIVLLFPVSVSAQATKAVTAVWLRADSDSISSSRWPDVSGNQRHGFSLATEGPELSGMLNYNPMLTFDGINDYLSIPFNIDGKPQLSMLAVFMTADTLERGIWGVEKALVRQIMQTSRKIAGPESAVDDYGKNENSPVLTSIVQNWTGIQPDGDEAFLALGSAGKERSFMPFKGQIAEFIVFDGATDFLERVKMETYLAIKYGITLNYSNYVSAADKVLWHGEENKGFGNRITGIGRDDFYDLYQKQSKSVADTTSFLTISVGSLQASNRENKAAINNGDFLLFGDNGLALTGSGVQLLDTVLETIERAWLVKATGETPHTIKTQLRVDLRQLPKSELGYWMVINRKGNADFSIDELEYFKPDSISKDSIACFSVLWDTDRSGKDVFSFAKAKILLAAISLFNNPTCNDQSGGKINFEIIGGTAPFSFSLKSVVRQIDQTWSGNEKLSLKGLEEGDYTLTVKDAKKNEITRNFYLKMPDALTVALGEDQKLATGNFLTLDAGIYIPDSVQVSYSWENNFGFRSSERSIMVTAPGIYTAMVTNELDGCIFTDEIAISGSEATKFAVFPNVVSAGVNYNISVSLTQAENIKIMIYDPKGQKYQQFQGQGHTEYHFIGQGREAGLYLIVLQTAKGVETQKLIVN